MNKRTELPTAENSSNFNRIAGATCQVGTTLENLKAAVCGETGASAKYAACAKLAKEKGYEQLGRLWEATSAAEQVHIRLEAGLVEELEPGYERPTADAPDDDSYFLCPGCGYIEKGSAAPEKCPICGAPAKVFKQF